jgi:hypothetical protein
LKALLRNAFKFFSWFGFERKALYVLTRMATAICLKKPYWVWSLMLKRVAALSGIDTKN